VKLFRSLLLAFSMGLMVFTQMPLAVAAEQVLPTLPQAQVDTTYSLPTGSTWTATNTSSASVAGTGSGNRTDCSVPYALANCAGGDVIIVTKNTTYTGPWTIPNLAGSSFVYVVSSGDTSVGGTGLPSAGTSVAPADATSMAKLQVSAAASSAAIQTTTSSHHFRLVGIEVTVGPTTTDYIANLISTGNGETSNSQVSNQIIFDRCYVHAGTSATLAGRRGFFLSGTNIAVIDSYVSGFFENGADSQAILGYQGNGPFKIHNNYLEGASENTMFGGTDPTIPNSVPSDITITHNYFFKPAAWLGAGHNVKNLLEFKNAQRVLVEGNIFENNWPDGQSGYSLLITPRNQSGTAPWCVTKDITIQKNKFINLGQGINILGTDNLNTSQRTTRVLITNNLMDVTGYGTAQGRILQILDGPHYLTITHNTIFCAGTSSFLGNSDNVPKADHFIFRDNLVTNGTIGFSGTGTVGATTTLAAFYTDVAIFTKNVLIGGNAGQNPANNFFPVDNAAVGFVDISGSFATNDYTLTSGSSYHNAASDGTDIGCDIAALTTAIS
jgi:hypothetical protein